MNAAGETARRGLILGLAGVEAGAILALGATRHAGWWLDWQMRTHPCAVPAPDAAAEPLHAAMRLLRAA